MSQLQKTKESLTTALSGLKAETDEVVKGSNRLSYNLAEAGKKIWRQVLVIWAVGIVLFISYVIFLDHKPVPISPTHKAPVSHQVAKTKTGTEIASKSLKLPPKVSTVSLSSEQEDLLKLLSQIREAQLKKDINMFMEAYSPGFAELAQKREAMLSIWKKYTYVDSQFMLSDLHQENPLTVSGKVIWDIKAQDQKTGTIRRVTKSYFVTFSKQSGKWLIQAINQSN